ncbi:hypothetical protein V6N12_052245 [Hibiscus sabdariffa]|uniref:Mechanosensitive ion channel MscS domain-containing protein n=1 Tax=Hibiscus sabdariffa TaxID=183260 RepID=A0ABR2GHP1_9ROSI
MAEKGSSGGEVVIDVHSEENPKGLKGSPPNEIEALDIEQNAQVPPTMSSPTAAKLSGVRIVKSKRCNKKKLKRVVIEWLIFLVLLGCLIASLTVDKLHNTRVWDLKTWKWCVLVLVTFCGMSVARWFMCLVVFLIERNFLLRNKVLCFVHGLKKTVQVFIWLSSVLVTWVILFLDVERSKTAKKILDNVTWVLVSILIGAFLWLLKTLLFMMLASSFHKNKFFDRIQESLFNEYILQTLSGPPLMELDYETISRSTVRNAKKGKRYETKKFIDIRKVHTLRRGKVSSWHMRVLVDVITNSGLSVFPSTTDESFFDEFGAQADIEITNEEEAKYFSHRIFNNVARHDSWHNSYIEKDDLLRFMIREEVDLVFPLFEGSHSGKIDRKSFTNWLVMVYRDRKVLAHGLSDTQIVIEQLNKLVIAILIVVTFIIWLLLVGTATTRVLLVIAAFLFGESCKTIFQVVVFIFVMHPFDVGDRCVVDGVQLMVEEINIFTTAFLKFNNEKVYYPNSVLFSKPISNYYRSPDMGETIEFCIDSRTPVETVGRLKEKIRNHLEANGDLWHPNHLVVVTEIGNDNKLKMALHCNHTMNFQHFRERKKRRTDLIIELKRILEELGISYCLLLTVFYIKEDKFQPVHKVRVKFDVKAYLYYIYGLVELKTMLCSPVLLLKIDAHSFISWSKQGFTLFHSCDNGLVFLSGFRLKLRDMAEKRSSGEEVVVNVHSEENPKVLKGSAPNEIETSEPLQNAVLSPTTSSSTADKSPGAPTEKYKRRNKKKLKRFVLEWFMFLLLSGCLIASLTVEKLHNTRFWDLETWKWCVLVMVTFSGMLVTRWLVCLVVFLIEISFLLRRRVMYFVHGLKKSVQTLLLMMFTSSFHKKNFFDRIQESVFHEYILQTLSGPSLLENAEETKKFIDTGKVHKLKREKVSSWHMKALVDAVTNCEQGGKEITSEMEARSFAHQIFRNVAPPPNDHTYIDEDDLLRFMIKEEVDLVFPLLQGSNTGKIDRQSFTNWVIKINMERKALAFTLSDTKTALEQLDKLVIAILIVVTFIIWLLLVGTATTRVLLVIAAFLFGETCKTIFQVVIFVFVMHPFDVGDRCVVDGVQLLVEEINILTTTFLKLNNEKVYYPNLVLYSKPISNYYRSPDMGEDIEFCIDSKTPAETIGRLKKEIKRQVVCRFVLASIHVRLCFTELIGLCICAVMSNQAFGDQQCHMASYTPCRCDGDRERQQVEDGSPLQSYNELPGLQGEEEAENRFDHRIEENSGGVGHKVQYPSRAEEFEPSQSRQA